MRIAAPCTDSLFQGNTMASSSGKSWLHHLVTFSVLAGSLYFAFQIIPPEFNNYEFQNQLAQQAHIATFYNSGNTAIRNQVMNLAQSLNLRFPRRAIHIVRHQGAVTIRIHFSVPITLPFYAYTMQFNDDSLNSL
jgi:hypothetical protein